MPKPSLRSLNQDIRGITRYHLRYVLSVLTDTQSQARATQRGVPTVTPPEQNVVVAHVISLLSLYEFLMDGAEWLGHRAIKASSDLEISEVLNRALPTPINQIDPTLRDGILELIKIPTSQLKLRKLSSSEKNRYARYIAFNITYILKGLGVPEPLCKIQTPFDLETIQGMTKYAKKSAIRMQDDGSDFKMLTVCLSYAPELVYTSAMLEEVKELKNLGLSGHVGDFQLVEPLRAAVGDISGVPPEVLSIISNGFKYRELLGSEQRFSMYCEFLNTIADYQRNTGISVARFDPRRLLDIKGNANAVLERIGIEHSIETADHKSAGLFAGGQKSAILTQVRTDGTAVSDIKYHDVAETAEAIAGQRFERPDGQSPNVDTSELSRNTTQLLRIAIDLAQQGNTTEIIFANGKTVGLEALGVYTENEQDVEYLQSLSDWYTNAIMDLNASVTLQVQGSASYTASLVILHQCNTEIQASAKYWCALQSYRNITEVVKHKATVRRVARQVTEAERDKPQGKVFPVKFGNNPAPSPQSISNRPIPTAERIAGTPSIQVVKPEHQTSEPTMGSSAPADAQIVAPVYRSPVNKSNVTREIMGTAVQSPKDNFERVDFGLWDTVHEVGRSSVSSDKVPDTSSEFGESANSDNQSSEISINPVIGTTDAFKQEPTETTQQVVGSEVEEVVDSATTTNCSWT